MIWRVYIRQHPKLGPLYTRIERQPSWVARTAFIAAVLVVVIPLLMLFTAALFVGIVLFILFGLIAGVIGVVARLVSFLTPAQGGPLESSDGRENVRVLHRD